MKYVLACLAAGLLFVSVAVASDSGEALYLKSCKGCHGADGAKVAMGMTRAVSDLSYEEARDALLGYKAGTFGGAKKVIMERSVKNLSDEDMDALAHHIATL